MSGNMADWYMTHENMITLMSFMAMQPEYDKGDMAYATEKPWKFDAVFYEATRQLGSTDNKFKLMLNTRYGKHVPQVAVGEYKEAADQILEHHAQMIHAARHPMGTNQVCDECREEARTVHRIVQED